MGTNRSKVRELKHMGLPGASISRGTNPRDLAEYALELFLTEQHIAFEDTMRQLRRLSPHHAKKVRDQVLELTEYTE